VRLLRLELRNYRNYRNLDLDLGGQLNLFLGANGQGKTNLLESIALLALSASPRTRREIEQIGPLAPEARVTGRVEGGGRRHEVRIDLREEAGRGRKRIAVDELPRRAFDLPGIAPAVLFWPEDLNLVKAGPEHRRRFLNQMLVQVEPGHARLISRYARILEQRNHLLKQIAAGETGIGTLDAWDEELVSAGGAVTDEVPGEAGVPRVGVPQRFDSWADYQSRIEVMVDGIEAGRFDADGAIVSTPTGSTGYALSLGGPILHPEVRALTYLPLNPHSLFNRAVVLPETVRLTVRLPDASGMLTCDGQRTTPLDPGAEVEIAAPHGVDLVRFGGDQNFFSLLRQKIRWGLPLIDGIP